MTTRILSQKYSFILDNGFNGGLSSENAIAVAQNKMIIADNILVGTAPTRRRRGGMEKYHTGSYDVTSSYPVAGSPIRGLVEYWRTASLAGNPVSDLFLHQTDKVWSIDDRNTIGVNRTGGLALATTGVPSYQVFNQRIYFCSTINADGYNVWDGSSATATAATGPADGPGKYLCSHVGRMVMAGNNDFPFRVYLSTFLDPEDWSSGAPSNATSLDLDDIGDPQGITGIVSFQNRLYVFTRQSTYEITGTDPADFIVLRVSNGIGCIANSTITTVPNDVLFCSDRGVHSLRQLNSGRQTESQFLSRDIQRLWTGLVNTQKFSQLAAAYDENINSYCISITAGSSTTASDMLIYNIEFGTWTQWKDIEARSITIGYLNNKKQILIGREDGAIAYLNRTEREDYDGTYSSRFKTGTLYPGGNFGDERRFINITILASATASANVSVSWNVDGARDGTRVFSLTAGEALLGSTFVLGQSILGIGQYLPYTMAIDQVGHGIQLDISVQSAGDVEFYGFILEVENANTVYGSRAT